MRAHPLAGQRFFLLEQPDDVGIASLYSAAAGLLFPTLGEGFGLPLIEAADRDLPILCSDLPVCREIAGPYAEYVDTGSAATLAAQIGHWWARCKRGGVRRSGGMPRLTWEKSAEMLLDVILEDNWMQDDDDVALHRA